MAASLHILVHKAYHARQQESEGMNVLSFEDWQIAIWRQTSHLFSLLRFDPKFRAYLSSPG